MRGITPCVLALLLAACGPKHSGSSGVDTDGATHGGQTGAATATRGGSSSTTDTEDRVVYEALCGYSTNGFFSLYIRKKHLDAEFCPKIVFVYPGINNSGESGVGFPPMSEWEMNPPFVVPDGSCILESPEDAALVLDASGTVWWDEAMSFVDVDVTLTLPPDPRWPDTDVLVAEGLPIQDRDQCPGIPTGTSGG